MKERWLAYVARFAALSERERAMLAVAAVALVIYVGNTLWLSPIYTRAENFAKQTAAQQKEFAKLQQQMAQLQAETAVDPNQAIRAQLAEAETQLQAINRQLASFEQSLVPPEKMAALLETLLRERRGVRLLSLKTLPAEALTAQDTAGQNAGGQPEATKASPLSIYRHGVELKLEGNYLDLQACLADLEAQSGQLLWHRAQLQAGGERRSTLSLVIYSLSLDKSWMSL